MDVALHVDHDLRLQELAVHWRIPGALAVVPLAIDLSHGMDVVGDGVGVDDLECLARLNAEDAWAKPTAVLIDDDGLRWDCEMLSFQAGLDVDEGVSE